MRFFRSVVALALFVFSITPQNLQAAVSDCYTITAFSEQMLQRSARNSGEFVVPMRSIKSFTSDIPLPLQNDQFKNYTDLISGIIYPDQKVSLVAMDSLLENYLHSKVQQNAFHCNITSTLVNISASNSGKIKKKLYTDANIKESPLPLFEVVNKSGKDITLYLAGKLSQEIIVAKYEKFFSFLKSEGDKSENIQSIFKICEKYKKTAPTLFSEIATIKGKIFENPNYLTIHRALDYLRNFTFDFHRSLYLIDPKKTQTESHNEALFSMLKIGDDFLAQLIPAKEEDKQEVLRLRAEIEKRTNTKRELIAPLTETEGLSIEVKTAIMGFIQMFGLSIPDPYL